MNKPYFYIIRHKPSNRYYAGVRYAKNLKHGELLKPRGYKTSSRFIHALIEKDGLDSFEVDRIRYFDNKKLALAYERKFLVKVNATYNDKFLNRTNNKGEIGYIDEAMRLTSLKKYGTLYPNQSDVVKNKKRATIQEKYGVDSYTQTEEFKLKTKKTIQEKYGVDYFSQSDRFRTLLSERQLGCKHHRFKGWYHTPEGKFGSSREAARDIELIDRKCVNKWCKNPDKVISKMSYSKNKYLNQSFSESIIGQTFRELGFHFEPLDSANKS